MRWLCSAAVMAVLAATAAPAFAEIVVGVAGPFSGPYAALGEQMARGAGLAVADINAAGGVLGEPLKLELVDDACDAVKAVKAAEEMAAKGIAAMIGHYCSFASIPASKVYEEKGIVQISPSTTNPQFTDLGRWNTHRIAGREDTQGALAGEYLAKTYAGKPVAIVHDGTGYGEGLAAGARKLVGKAAIDEAYEPGTKDFAPLVTRLKEAGIVALYAGAQAADAGRIVREMRQQRLEAQLVAGDAVLDPAFWDIAGKAGEGTLMTFPPDPLSSPAAKSAIEAFKAVDYTPEGYALHTYAAFQAWAQAAVKAGSVDGRKVAQALRSGTEFSTVLGRLSFDGKGDVSLPAYVWCVWRGGAYLYDDALNKRLGLTD